MKNNYLQVTLMVIFFCIGNSFAQCPDQLTNQSTSIQLSSGSTKGGASATAVSVGSSCGLRVQTNSGNAWGKYIIPFNLADNGLVPGDQFEISMDITNQTGNFLFQITRDNYNARVFYTSSSLPISGTIITVPSDATSLHIWLYTNHGEWSESGSMDISNLNVAKVGAGNNDTQAPTVPTNISVANITSSSADVSWTASTDNDGGNVTGYKIYDSGTEIADISGISTTLNSLTEQTTYDISIAAYDDASTSNISNPSNPEVQFTTLSSGGGNTGGGSGDTVWTEANSTASYSGNVAIGVSTVPNGYKMAIDGKLITEEVKVQLSGDWPDYVFKENYTLPTLQEVEKHIQEKRHLINIPSAKEVEVNGIELGEMNKLLLEKIEELTLYVLKQQREIDALKKVTNN